MKKANTILSIVVFLLLMVALSATCHSQTIVRIDSVKWVGSWKADIVGRNEKGEVFYLHYGFSKRIKQYIRPGQWLQITPVNGRERDGRTRSKIIIYNR